MALPSRAPGSPVRPITSTVLTEHDGEAVDTPVTAEDDSLPIVQLRPQRGRETTPAVAVSSGIGRLAADGAIIFNAPAAEVAAPVQRQAEGPSASPAAAAAPAAPAPAGDASSHDNEKLEQLAKQLYDKIRERLKAELRLDRERWGRVTDLTR